ncbi:MAG: zeta toxin family protein [Planctomycetaceae bacterium]|nr:zeta toxin family protein [Planctomycetaceae bacterium]
MTDHDPMVVVIAGPNGAGKTTISKQVLRNALHVEEFVNADAIAAGLSEYHPERVAITAGRMMLDRLDELAESKASFAFETTLSTRSFAPKIESWKAAGYSFQLVFVWVPSPDVSVKRIEYRVSLGGHNVPEETVRRRYDRSLRNLFELYLPLADQWEILDNSRPGEKPRAIAEGGRGIPVNVSESNLWNILETTYGNDNNQN